MRQVLLDTFGADLGTAELIKGAVMALRSRDDFEFVLFGNEDEIKAVLSEENHDGSRITIVNATDFITNEDNPMSVFRGRENSSMVLALNYLKTNENAHGLLSAGSTGALMVGSIAHVGIKKGLSTPVLGSLIPNPFTSWKLLVDCGAHLTPTAADLVTFARLGAKYYAATFNNTNPTIGLLSVGSEPGKGTELVKEAYKLLDESDLNFVGNVEGSDLDIRGCVLEQPSDIIGFTNFEEYCDSATDTTIYGFNKLVKLLVDCTPNPIEMLGGKPEHYLYMTFSSFCCLLLNLTN